MTHTTSLLMLYVQYAVSEGLEPDDTGIYHITRKDFLDVLGISSSTFDKNKAELVEMLSSWDLETIFNLTGLTNEYLYTDVSYQKGELTFRRNPLTLRPELSYVWGIRPKYWEQRMFSYPFVLVPDYLTLPIRK